MHDLQKSRILLKIKWTKKIQFLKQQSLDSRVLQNLDQMWNSKCTIYLRFSSEKTDITMYAQGWKWQRLLTKKTTVIRYPKSKSDVIWQQKITEFSTRSMSRTDTHVRWSSKIPSLNIYRTQETDRSLQKKKSSWFNHLRFIVTRHII